MAPPLRVPAPMLPGLIGWANEAARREGFELRIAHPVGTPASITLAPMDDVNPPVVFTSKPLPDLLVTVIVALGTPPAGRWR